MAALQPTDLGFYGKPSLVIFHFQERQAAGGGGGAGELSVAGFEEGGHGERVAFSLADLDERSDENADHILQEALADEGEADLIGGLPDLNGEKLPHGGFLHVRVAAEAFEIVPANEKSGGGLHGRRVESPAPMLVDILPFKNVKCLVFSDAVAIGFLACVVAAVKARSRLGDGKNADVVREVLVEIRADLLRIPVLSEPELGDLPLRVYACVGAAGAVDIHGFSGHPKKDRLQFFLDRVFCIALLLPAVVAGAVILYEHLIIRHD